MSPINFNSLSFKGFDFRKQFGYPPYTHCAVIQTRSNHERRAEFTLQNLHQRLKSSLPKGMVLHDPLPAPITKAHGQYRFQLMMLATSARQLSQHISDILSHTPPPEDVTITFDMDAMGF